MVDYYVVLEDAQCKISAESPLQAAISALKWDLEVNLEEEYLTREDVDHGLAWLRTVDSVEDLWRLGYEFEVFTEEDIVKL